MGKNLEVKVPDIGDYHDVPVIEVLVKNGDTVVKDQPLLTLESDKAMMEVPAPEAGIVRGFKLKAGDKVSQGDLICSLETTSAAVQITASPQKHASPPAGGKQGEGSKPALKETSPDPVRPHKGGGSEASQVMDVLVPDIGNYSGVPVIEVLVKDGDRIEKDAPLLVLESDKSTMEVPAPEAGIVRGFKLKAGDKVSQGDLICKLEVAVAPSAAPTAPVQSPLPLGEAAPKGAGEGRAVSTRVSPPAVPGAAAQPGHPSPGVRGDGSPVDSRLGPANPYAGPATRKFARQLGVDLKLIQGSGPRGRIVIEDVQAYVKKSLASPPPPAEGGRGEGQGLPTMPIVDFSQWGEIEKKPLARIRKLSAAHLHRAWLNIPHVTQFDEADITEVEEFRKSSAEESGIKLTLLPFIMKAVAKTLEAYPEFNSSLAPDGENLILKKYCHIGFAADTENGLVVPVVRDVNKKGVVQLAEECGVLAKKARDGKLKADEMKGGCFSISSLGGIGGSHFTPIVNAPEVAILGASRARMKPVWNGREFTPRLMLPLSLSYDHRVIDGAYAARFMVHLVKLLSDVRRLAL